MDQKPQKTQQIKRSKFNAILGLFLDFQNLWWKSQIKSRSVATKGY
jgi:hypothetical protein